MSQVYSVHLYRVFHALVHLTFSFQISSIIIVNVHKNSSNNDNLWLTIYHGPDAQILCSASLHTVPHLANPAVWEVGINTCILHMWHLKHRGVEWLAPNHTGDISGRAQIRSHRAMLVLSVVKRLSPCAERIFNLDVVLTKNINALSWIKPSAG